MPEETIECDIGPNLRQWLLAIPAVSQHCGQRIVDTIPSECDKPFIWFTMMDATDSESLCGGFDEFDYAIEIVAPESQLAIVKQLKMIVTNRCLAYERGEPFGHADYWVQSIEIIKLADNYQPVAPMYLGGVVFAVMAIRITP
jgi:hypothetical protein